MSFLTFIWCYSAALLNWGLAMRDRSRLRPLGSKDRRKIMAQAKEIFEEALRLDPNYGQARGAVAASTVELKRLQEYEEEPRESRKAPNSRGLLDWWSWVALILPLRVLHKLVLCFLSFSFPPFFFGFHDLKVSLECSNTSHHSIVLI